MHDRPTVRLAALFALAPALFAGALAGPTACSSARPNPPESYPGVTFPAHFAEGDPADAAADSASGAVSAAAPSSSAANVGSAPDPEPLRLARQYDFLVVYDRGRLRLGRVRALAYPKPVVTARRMGRFAIELWIGAELVDRARFDFPLLGAEDVPRGKRRRLRQPPSLAAGASVEQHVLVPASPRATRAVLVDRATGDRLELPWPPESPLGPPLDELPPPPVSTSGEAVPASVPAVAAPSAATAPSAAAGE